MIKQYGREATRKACARRAGSTALRLLTANDGLAALEFALVAPILLMLLVGTVEFSQALTVDRRVTQAAGSTADLIARTTEITTGEIDGIMQIVGHLMRPYDPSRLRITVLNVAADLGDPTRTRVCWSYEYNGGSGSYANGAAYPLPQNLVEAGGSVIVAEVTYDYQPIIFNYFIRSAFPLTETLYLKPRLSSYVKYNGNSCS